MAERTPLDLRIQTIIDAHGLNQTSLGKIAGLSKGRISQLRHGPVDGEIPYEPARKIADRFGYSLDWVMYGKPPMIDAKGVASDVDSEELPYKGDLVPVVGYVQGGDRGYFEETGYPTGHGEGYVLYPTRDPSSYALRVRGDSMRPRIKPGEYIVAVPHHHVMAGCEVVVKTKDGRVMVKKLGGRHGGSVELQSVNETDYPPISVEESEIEKMHFVAAIVSDYLYRAALEPDSGSTG